MRKLLLLTACAAVAAPGVAATGTPASTKAAPTVAPRACRTLQARMGAPAFRQAFKTLGVCVSRLAPVDELNQQAASELCRAEQSDAAFASTHGGKTFAEFYGRGRNDANAFGNCVSTKMRSSVAAIQSATPNPARTCRSMRTTMTAATFALTFGTNANHSDAFGKCVSHVARAGAANLVAAAQACTAELGDASFAATHAGRTFAAVYGTNSDLSNAFGRCVAQKAQAAAALQRQELVAAAKACRSERRSDPAAFRSKYGSRPNAFGRCVAQKTSS